MGRLLFDFDANVRELRYVAEAVWTEGSLKEAFVGGRPEQEEAFDGGVKTKRPSRGWWSLSTKPAWDIHALPWNVEKHKNKEDSISIDEEELEADEDEELYLAETEEQLKDLDTMVYAAADIPWQRALIPSDKESSKLVIHDKSWQPKRKSKPNLDDSQDWDHCMDQACFRGKERLKELLVERFPLRDPPSSSACKKAKRPNNVPAGSTEVCTGTILLDAVRQEERQLVECKWVEPTSTNVVWGFNRGAGGCLPDGGWALCGDLVRSFVAPAKKSISRSRSGRNSQAPLASGLTQASPQRIVYPAHTIDDRMELDSMVAAAKARSALHSAETIATDGDLSTTKVKTSSVDKVPGNRSLGPLIPSRWARLTARELLDLIPMQSLALVAADSTTYGPFLDHVRTKSTGQASPSPLSSSSASSSSIKQAALVVGHDEDWKILREALAVASASAMWLEERDADFETLILGGGCTVTGQPRLTQLLHLADDTPSRSVLAESGSDALERSKMRGTQPKVSSQIKSTFAAPVLTCLDLTRILSSLSYSSSASAAVISALSTCEDVQKRAVVLGPASTGRSDDAWKHHLACSSRTNPSVRSNSSAKAEGYPIGRGDLERSLRLLQAAAAAHVLSADEYWRLAASFF